MAKCYRTFFQPLLIHAPTAQSHYQSDFVSLAEKFFYSPFHQ